MRKVVRAAGGWFGRQVDEILVAVGLALVTVGLWPVAGRSALVVPGLVLLWIALPQRVAFVARVAEKPKGGQ